MKNNLPKILVLSLACFMLAGCATITNNSEYDVAVDTVPAGANFVITDKNSKVLAKGITPEIIKLRAANAPFSIRYTQDGFSSKTLNHDADVAPVFWMNIPASYGLGCLVDWATGYMWVLRPLPRVKLVAIENNISKHTPPAVFLPKVARQYELQNSPGKMFAVVIGISNYRHKMLLSLPYADDDAKGMKQTLQRQGWSSSRIKVLTNSNATMLNVRRVLDGWLTKAGKNDLIVLFWSGHGFPDPDDSEKVYLACYDTDPREPYTGYRMDHVVASLKEKRTRNVIVIADTCHAGKLVTRGKRGLAVRPYMDKMRRKKQIPKGWIFMVSADADRKAIEHSSWSNGAFTYCLLKGLQGEADGFEGIGKKDGKVTMRELRVYLSSKMPDETQKVLGVAKHPLITTSSGDPKIWDLSLSNSSKKGI